MAATNKLKTDLENCLSENLLIDIDMRMNNSNTFLLSILQDLAHHIHPIPLTVPPPSIVRCFTPWK